MWRSPRPNSGAMRNAKRRYRSPIPESVTRCGLPPPSSLTISHAVELPALRGVKVTLTVQLAPGAREVPHPLISANSSAR